MSPFDSESLKFWETVALCGFGAVILGVVLEGVELLAKWVERWTKRELPGRLHAWILPVETIGFAILLIGLSGELIAEKRAKRIADKENTRLTQQAGEAFRQAAFANSTNAVLAMQLAAIESTNLVLRSNVAALDKEAAETKLEVAKANERAAEANKLAAESNERSRQLEKDNLVLKGELELVRRENEPRVFVGRDQAAGNLSKFNGVTARIFAAQDLESQRTAKQIEAVLLDAGWVIVGPRNRPPFEFEPPDPGLLYFPPETQEIRVFQGVIVQHQDIHPENREADMFLVMAARSLRDELIKGTIKAYMMYGRRGSGFNIMVGELPRRTKEAKPFLRK